MLCDSCLSHKHACCSVVGAVSGVSAAEKPSVISPGSPAAAVSSPSKPIRMVTDPRPAKPVSPPDDGRTETTADQRPTQVSDVQIAAVVKETTADVRGAEKAPKGGGIGRHRLPEAEPKLEKAKVPSKACCGGCSIM